MLLFFCYFICLLSPDTEIEPLGKKTVKASRRKIRPKALKFQAGKSISTMELTRPYLKFALPSPLYTLVLMLIQLHIYKKDLRSCNWVFLSLS